MGRRLIQALFFPSISLPTLSHSSIHSSIHQSMYFIHLPSQSPIHPICSPDGPSFVLFSFLLFYPPTTLTSFF